MRHNITKFFFPWNLFWPFLFLHDSQSLWSKDSSKLHVSVAFRFVLFMLKVLLLLKVLLREKGKSPFYLVVAESQIQVNSIFFPPSVSHFSRTRYQNQRRSGTSFSRWSVNPLLPFQECVCGTSMCSSSFKLFKSRMCIDIYWLFVVVLFFFPVHASVSGGRGSCLGVGLEVQKCESAKAPQTQISMGVATSMRLPGELFSLGIRS